MYRIVFLGGEDVSARIDISNELIKKGCHIEILGSESPVSFVGSCIKYQQFYLNREFDILGDIKSLLQIRKILKNYNIETVVHAFDTKLTIMLPIAAIGLSNIKVVRTINGMGRVFTTSNLKNMILRFVYKCIQKSLKSIVDYTIFQNTDNYNYFLKNNLVTKTKSTVVRSSGINLKEYSVTIEEEVKAALVSTYIKNRSLPTFILVSRLIKQKGISNYLQAAKLCHDDGHKFNFLLVGQIDSNDDATSLEEINSYKKYVQYLGERSNIKEILAISDVFVLPTYYSEGVPRVLLEASAMSLAILTTNMPGCNDVLRDEFNGKIIKVNNSLDVFEKMKYVVRDVNTLNTFKNNAFSHVHDFSLEKVTSEYFNIYKKVAS